MLPCHEHIFNITVTILVLYLLIIRESNKLYYVSKKVFLTAEWKYLAILNYEVDPSVLKRYIPPRTELDNFNYKTYVSIVGFQFKNTLIRNIPIPFHKDFEEINLRFYVRYKSGLEWRRGVVFIKEIVPRRAISYIANNVFNENYISLPTRHFIKLDGKSDYDKQIRYMWRFNSSWNYFYVIPKGNPKNLKPGSLEEFITEHYWGYNIQNNNKTLEYQVEHPRWRVWDTIDEYLNCDIGELYGEEFIDFIKGKPDSSMLAEGSEVKVYDGQNI